MGWEARPGAPQEPHPCWVTPQSSPQPTPGSALGSQLLPLSQIPLPPARSTKTWFTNNYQGSRYDPVCQVCFGLSISL